jgi:hypothetical protein
VVALMTVMTRTIQQLLDEANALADTDPEAARLVLALSADLPALWITWGSSSPTGRKRSAACNAPDNQDRQWV